MTQRRGFTLIEVLIALVIMGIVTGALYRLLNTSQRLSLAQAEQVSLQSNVRTGSLVVPNELRELNTVLARRRRTQNDITDRGRRRRSPIGPCAGWGSSARRPAANELRISCSPAGPASAPRTGPGQPVPLRRWRHGRRGRRRLAPGGDHRRGHLGHRLRRRRRRLPCWSTAAAVPAVPLNTPVRLFEVMRLELYADDGEWWLGARSVSAGEATSSRCSAP